MNHNMTLFHDSFIAVKSLTKTIEMRLYDEKRQKVKKGDTITFTDIKTKEQICFYVFALHIYPTFDELYQHFDKIKLGYTEEEIANPNDMLAYYSLEDILKYGVVGIELKTKKDYDFCLRIENTMNVLKDFAEKNLKEEDASLIKNILKTR